MAGEQLAATVDQLLLAYNVQEPGVWAPIVKRLADEAAGMLSPGKAVAYGNLDPRFYIKVRLRQIHWSMLNSLMLCLRVAHRAAEAETDAGILLPACTCRTLLTVSLVCWIV